MHTIIINKTEIKVPAAEARMLATLARYGYACPLGFFDECVGSYAITNIARQYAYESYESQTGVQIFWRHWRTNDQPSRVVRFFARHPRHQYCVSGNPRRVNLVNKRIAQMRLRYMRPLSQKSQSARV